MAGLKPASAQVEQNPFWVLPNLSNTTMNFVKNLQTPNPVGTLPFTTPPTTFPISYPQFNVRTTSANGIFDECGDVIFYVMNDNIFDENGISTGSRNLILKDRWIKWDDPGDPTDNGSPQEPFSTENFEAPIFTLSGVPDTYYLLYSDCAIFGCGVRLATYNIVTKSLSQQTNRVTQPALWSTGSSQVRMAVSDLNQNGGRDIYFVDNTNELTRISVDQVGTFQPPVTLLAPSSLDDFVCPELELSPTGEYLAWATSNGGSVTIHTYNVSSGSYVTFALPVGAIQSLVGLEFTRNNSLAISANWDPLYGSPPGTNANDGVMIIDPSFTSGTHITGSDPYTGAMIELAADNTGSYIYANNGSSMIAINVNTFTIDATYFIPSVASTGLGSPFGGPFASGALPDQNDGEFYVFPLNCGPGGSNGPPGPPGGNRMAGPNQGKPPRIVPLKDLFIKTVH